MNRFLSHFSFVILLTAISMTAMAQSMFRIKMDLTGFKDSTKFSLVDLDSGKVVDSSYLSDGKVFFQGSVITPVAARIHTVDNKYLVIYLENRDMTVSGTYKDYEYSNIEGSDINAMWVKSRNAQKDYQVKRDSLIKVYFSLSESDKHLGKAIGSQINIIDSIVLNYRKSFIRQEKPSYFTMQELYFLRNDLGKDSLKYLFNRFPEQLRLTNQGSVIYQYINNVKPELGSKFIDIEAENLTGKKVKISDFNGKYVLLDFWASWCAPCRQENPEFVKVYEEFKNKGFEIYGYSTDVNRASWAKAIESDNLPWVNVSDLKGFYSEGPARYQVRAIPQNFLIDKKGFIIARNIKSEGLRVKLRELFKE